ncbi:peptidoglycan editing factor PgeF [Thermodesulfobacteriota bacterium]
MFPIKKYYRKFRSELADKPLHFQFSSLVGQDRLIHRVFTRHGGVSKSPYMSLNTSYKTGDRPGNVNKNLQIIRDTIGSGQFISMNQVHGSDIFSLCKNSNQVPVSTPEADAIITDIPLMALMVKLADCQGVILFDAVKTVISIIHCGWRGNVLNILGSVVGRMKSEFGCRETDILAAIGPSLGPCCAEFTTYMEIFPEEFERFMVRKNYFDLWEISRYQLLESGLRKENIEVEGTCTKCNRDLFYSYRAEGITGRFATVAMIGEPV